MTLQTRKPTGKPSWPIVLLAGAEKTGKSWAAAVASKSDLIGRTYWVTIGEDQPDEYGLIGDFDIVEHNGTLQGLLGALRDVAAQPAPEAGVPLLVVDSMTRLWDLLKDLAQDTANKRRNKKPGDDATITSDLWNVAAGQWQDVMDAVRAFRGPVVLTARLDEVAVMDDKGQPTKEKQRKVQAHKTLVYDVGAVIEMPVRGEAYIAGLRSVHFPLPERTKATDFSLEDFWRKLGLAETVTGPRSHAVPRLHEPAAEPPPPPKYDPAVIDPWFREITDSQYLGPRRTADGPGLRAVAIRAARAHVLEMPIEETADGSAPMTVQQLIEQVARRLPEALAPGEEPEPAPEDDDVPMWASASAPQP